MDGLCLFLPRSSEDTRVRKMVTLWIVGYRLDVHRLSELTLEIVQIVGLRARYVTRYRGRGPNPRDPFLIYFNLGSLNSKLDSNKCVVKYYP